MGYGIGQENGHGVDLEGQKYHSSGKWLDRTTKAIRDKGGRVAAIIPVISNPKRWDRQALWQNVVVAPVACLPAVVVGLLLNILDALSYGEHTWAKLSLRYADMSRHDFVPLGKPDLCELGLCRDINILRQLHHFTINLLDGEYL